MGIDCFDFLGGFGGEEAKFRIILVVQIAVVLGSLELYLTAGFDVRGGEFLGFVIAFGSPRDVVSVAEGIDVQDIDVGWGEEEVLD